MPLTGLLTSDDLDEIGCASADQPLGVAAELVNAVDHGLVADQADTGYALMLAAEITEQAGDLQAAQVLAQRAVETYRAHDDLEVYPRAFNAELLLRLEREDEAMAEFTALRPSLLEDPDAVSCISEALEDGGRAEIAEQWLTEALVTALDRLPDLDSQLGQPAYQQALGMVFVLVQERHQLRRNLNLPHDEHDILADSLVDAIHDAFDVEDPDYEDPDYEGTALLFWPRPEFDRLIQRWPGLAEEYGRTWDDYRMTAQRCLVQWSESGHTKLALFAGAVDELVHYADRDGGDPTDSLVRQGYAQHLAEHPREIAWPPAVTMRAGVAQTRSTRSAACPEDGSDQPGAHRCVQRHRAVVPELHSSAVASGPDSAAVELGSDRCARTASRGASGRRAPCVTGRLAGLGACQRPRRKWPPEGNQAP